METTEVQPIAEVTTLQKYQREIEKDTKLDRIILEEVQLKLPAIKAKWQSRCMNHKVDIDNLTDLYNEALVKIAQKIETESPIALSQIMTKKQAENHPLAIKIQKQIRENTRIVEYLEKIEKTFASMSYDMKNMVELIKQETT
jgi:hypothetical protein